MRSLISTYPAISIIIPSFNQANFIERTLESALSQKYPALELLVFDGGSTDATVSVLRRYEKYLRWVSRQDNGQSDAINQGLKIARGEIVTYLNSDDLLLPGSLERVAYEFTEHPNTLWLTGQCKIIDGQGLEIRRPVSYYKNVLLSTRSYSVLMVTNYISQPATFWRRSLMETAGYLDESLHYVMDYEYWLRLWHIAQPKIIHQNLAAFRVHALSKTTSSGHLQKYIQEELDVLNKHKISRFLVGAHHLHRFVMTAAYTLLNGGRATD